MGSDYRSRGEKWADRVASAVGSWKFIAFQSTMIVIWIVFNTLWLTGKIHFDKYPFVLLNLGFSTQAAYAAPILQMSNNRRATIEQEHSDTMLSAMMSSISATHAVTQALRDMLESRTALFQSIIDAQRESAQLLEKHVALLTEIDTAVEDLERLSASDR